MRASDAAPPRYANHDFAAYPVERRVADGADERSLRQSPRYRRASIIRARCILSAAPAGSGLALAGLRFRNSVVERDLWERVVFVKLR